MGPQAEQTVVLANGVGVPLGRTVASAIPPEHKYVWKAGDPLRYWRSDPLESKLATRVQEEVAHFVFCLLSLFYFSLSLSLWRYH